MPARERSIFGRCSSGTFGHTTQLSPQWIVGVILVLRLRCHYLQTQEVKSPSIDILYRKIGPLCQLQNRRAGKSPARLDVLPPEDGLPVEFDEIRFGKLWGRSRLVAYAKQFPNTVIQTLVLPYAGGRNCSLRP